MSKPRDRREDLPRYRCGDKKLIELKDASTQTAKPADPVQSILDGLKEKDNELVQLGMCPFVTPIGECKQRLFYGALHNWCSQTSTMVEHYETGYCRSCSAASKSS